MMLLEEKPLCFYIECELHRFRDIPQTVPEIVLQGTWLNKMGFKPGNRILVAAQEGEIVLRLAGETPEE